jgi:phenylalanyl-tRNA synthetase beta chain
MNISYQWLKELLPELESSPAETAEVLAIRGAPVEELVHLAPGLETLVVARVEGVEPHPNADSLSVCLVNAGGDILQVVCGAPNVKAESYYPFAPVGSALPDGSKIGKVKLRGMESHGMLCSEEELGMGPDGSGIMELKGSFEAGQALTEALALDDWRMDVEITANRGDLLSHIGIARELATAGQKGITLPVIPPGPESEQAGAAWGSSDTRIPLETGEGEVSGGGATVSVQDPELCSRYLGAVIRGVTVGPSPEWLASRLRAAGSRPINNVVDATNYVLLELGQPLHAFDLQKLSGSSIIVRSALEGETLRTLDGEDRTLKAGMLAICDTAGPVAIAGVMGGSESEVSDQTTDILLECALFDPASVRATRNALEMSTDASYRFERGVDPAGLELAVQRAVEVILATSGGVPDPRVLDSCPRPWPGLTVPLRLSRIKKLLGITLTYEEVRDLLSPLGFQALDQSDGVVEVAVPGFRSYDVRREVDLLEEVARTYGYDRFPSDLGSFRPGTVPDHPLFQLEDELRDLMVGEGFYEAQTMAFAPESEGEEALSNPVSMEEGFLRTSLIPGLIRRIEYNFARGTRDIRLFELGTVFFHRGEEDLPREEPRLCVVLTGSREPAHWTEDPVPVDLWYLKGLLGRLVTGARLQASVADDSPPPVWAVPGEAFAVVDGEGAVQGFAGRVSADRVDAPAWAGPVWGIELTLPREPAPISQPLFQPPPAFPGVDRDLALLLPTSLKARMVQQVIVAAAGPLLVDLHVFDLYEGEGVPANHRSVAFRLLYQSDERTLTDEDVERSVKAVTDRLREELGVEPRG